MGKATYEEGGGKNHGGIILVVITGVLALAILVFLFLFRITSVTVEGNIHYTEDEIKSMVMEGIFSGNSVLLSLTKKDEEIGNVPFMERIHVELTGRDSIRITVTEKNVVGYVEHENACWYFDRSGVVVEKSDTPVLTAEERVRAQNMGDAAAEAVTPKEEPSGDGTVPPQEADGEEQVITPAEGEGADVTTAVEAEAPVKNFVPSVHGLVFETITLGQELKIDNPGIFDTLFSLNQMINKDNIPPDYVMFDGDSNIFLYYDTVEVRLGRDEKLEEKMNTLASLMPQMAGLSGTLHLENYSDVQNGIIFRKNT